MRVSRRDAIKSLASALCLYIYDMYDGWFRAGEFGLADQCLANQQALREPVDFLLAHLTATLPAKSKLPSRAAFVARCKEYLGAEVMRGLE